MNQQTRNEIRIFKKFTRICPYPFNLNSITEKNPPKPDISCNLSDGSTMAFEVVQCIDDPIARSTNDSLKLDRVFGNELEKLPREKRWRFVANFRDALIYIAFSNKISINKKVSSIPKILDYLLTLENAIEGKFDIHSHQDIRRVVRCISINRGGVAGPRFHVEAATFFGDPCKRRIQCKFEKRYEIKYRTELLAYYELQPEIPENHWLPSAQEFVKNNIENSVFQRVWIYSATKNKIIFVYPVFKDFERGIQTRLVRERANR